MEARQNESKIGFVHQALAILVGKWAVWLGRISGLCSRAVGFVQKNAQLFQG